MVMYLCATSTHAMHQGDESDVHLEVVTFTTTVRACIRDVPVSVALTTSCGYYSMIPEFTKRERKFITGLE